MQYANATARVPSINAKVAWDSGAHKQEVTQIVSCTAQHIHQNTRRLLRQLLRSVVDSSQLGL